MVCAVASWKRGRHAANESRERAKVDITKVEDYEVWRSACDRREEKSAFRRAYLVCEMMNAWGTTV
jgi:hypothetical protein